MSSRWGPPRSRSVSPVPPSFSKKLEQDSVEVEDGFEVIDSVEWGPPEATDLDELAPKPKAGRVDDPCGCFPEGITTCNDLSCVLFACQEECRSNCTAGEFCGNKRIQRKDWKQFKVIDAGKKGRGLQIEEEVKKGDLITEYCGRAINKKFLPRLFQRYGNERKLYIMALDKDVYLDARTKGSLARYINHSCEPNCVVERWKVRGIIRAAVIAKKDMPAGTELCFDYQWERKRGRAPTKCHCYSPTCRGTLEVARSMEEQALERKLNDHWKKPFIQKPQREIVNRCIKVFSKSSQEYFTGDVTAYSPETGKHLIMYRHDLEEVWEDLKAEDWMILDEEAEQFIIRKKDYSTEREGSLLLPNANLLLQGQSQSSKNYIYVQTKIKDLLESKHLIERCQRSCRVTITPQPVTASSSKKDISDIEFAERSQALSLAQDGTIYKLTIVGYDISKAHSILEKNVAFIERKFFDHTLIEANPSSANPFQSDSNVTPQEELPHEVILPRSIVDIAKRRLPVIREKCRSVNITFVPSESKSKQFAKLVIEGTLQSDVDAAKEQLWNQLVEISAKANAPKTPSGLYKDLCFLGGELSSRDYHNLLEYDSYGKHNSGNWSPFLSSFEICQRCTVWVQEDSDKGRINSANHIVDEYQPNQPRKIYFGCSPSVVPKLWNLIKLRTNEVGRGVKYLYLGSDRLFQPMMMKHGGQFLEFIRQVTGASVNVDTMTGDYLRIDGRNIGTFQNPISPEATEGQRASLAEELIRLQIELYRDNHIRKQSWIFGRDWSLAAKKSAAVAEAPSTSGRTPGSSMDQKQLTNACSEISDIVATLKMDASVAAHACVIMYRFSVICKSPDLKMREILLACVFVANKAQKVSKWKPLERVLEAAYSRFYPGFRFDPQKEEVLVWEEKVISAEQEILAQLKYDVFWRGFDWIMDAACSNRTITKEMAQKAVALSCSKPILAAGAELWLGYGPEHVFCAALGFLGANLKSILSALALIPIKVMQVADIIAKSYKEQSKRPLSQEEKIDIEKQLPSINATCTSCMILFATQNPSRQPSETEQRYLLIGARGCMQRVFPRVPSDIVASMVLPHLDGISAESNCSIFVEQNDRQNGLHNIQLMGDWRAISIASYLLDQCVRGQFEPPIDSAADFSSSQNNTIQAKGEPGLLGMEAMETADAWKGTVQSEITNQSFWGRKTGGKCCIPAKIKESQLREAGLRWWLPPRYGPSPTGSICDMFLVNNNSAPNLLKTLGDLTLSFQGNSPGFSMLTSGSSSTSSEKSSDRFVAVSLQRWPSEKVAKHEEKQLLEKNSSKSKKRKHSSSDVKSMQMGFSPAALQEMQLLHKLHSLIKSPQGHPNFILPVGVALPSASENGETNDIMDVASKIDGSSNSSKNKSSLDSMKRIDEDIEDIFSLTRTSLENEVAAKDERKRKGMVTGPHIVFHATPFVLQRFSDKKKKRESSLSPKIFATWLHDLLSAMLHCHSNDIILRTLQQDQIVVDHGGVAKIGGFHRATVLGKRNQELDYLKLAKRSKEQHKRNEKESRQKDKEVRDDDLLSNIYAAPEMLLGSPKYSKETDIWTLGCLFAHLLLKKPLYSGKDRESLLSSMFKIIGTPSSQDFPEAAKFPHYSKPLKKYSPGVSKALASILGEEEAKKHESAIDLIDKMLQLDPRKRITAKGALQHHYMHKYSEESMSEHFRQAYVNDWISLKKQLMHSSKSEADERQEQELTIKRKALLMAASSKTAETEIGDDDDLYDMDDILEPKAKVPKV